MMVRIRTGRADEHRGGEAMTDKQLEGMPGTNPSPPPDRQMAMPTDWKQVKFAAPTDEDMNLLSALRSGSEPWKQRGETQAESLEALTKLRPFISVGKLNGAVVGYVTIERDGPVPGAAYLRNIVVKNELRQKGLGHVLLDQGLAMARDMN